MSVLVARVGRVGSVMRSFSPEWRDSFLYAASAVFAAATALAASIPLYRQWGDLALGPYLFGAVLMGMVAWRAGVDRRSTDADHGVPPDVLGAAGGVHARRWRWARLGAFTVVLAGATVVPLGLEVVWASEGNVSAHVQPEVLVVERAGVRVDAGKSPYQVIDRGGHIVIHVKSEPVYELYYPYLPGMVLFGFSSGSKVEARLTDARIQFLLFTVIVALVALSRLKPASDARFRAFQVLTLLPTAALPLATGGDDMPVVSLMLLGLVAIQRRQPLLAGLALGAASSLKFTAWPLALLVAWVVWDRRSRRSVGWYALGAVLVVGPVVVPVALSNPSAFIDNVIRFPLGLAGVASPAASPLPGHFIVSAFPGIHRPYVMVVVAVGLAALAWRLVRRPPRTPAAAASLTGVVMLVAILVAPATRVGYLLYPINLFVWAWMLRRAEDPSTAVEGERPPERAGRRLSPGPAARTG